jgi:hypothetical protein
MEEKTKNLLGNENNKSVYVSKHAQHHRSGDIRGTSSVVIEEQKKLTRQKLKRRQVHFSIVTKKRGQHC